MTLAFIAALVSVIAFYGQPKIIYHGREGVDLASQLQKLKAPSLKPWENDLIAGERLDAFAYARLAMAIRGFTKIEIGPAGNRGPITISIGGLKETGGIGAAVVVSSDGYILTAAHCIDAEPVALIVKESDRMLKELRPRVVWRGEANTKSAPDLALLHVDHKFPSFFILGREKDIAKNFPVLSSGYSQFDEANCAGAITRVGCAQSNASGARWIVFEHSAPNMEGDSGGPAFDLKGQLVGINVQANVAALRWRGEDFILRHRTICHQPDASWLKELMDKDRRTRVQAASPPSADTR